MLTRALGHSRMADGRPLVPDVLAEPLNIEKDDALIMCSDGLHDLMEDWEISQMVAGHTPDEAAQLLIEAACDRGGHDNITVAVVAAGDRCGEYDPNFVPSVVDYEHEEVDAEITFDDLSKSDVKAPMAAAMAAPPVPQKGGNSSLMIGGLAVGVLFVGVLGIGAVAAVGMAIYFFM